jgi:hypothetical protein
LCGIAMHPDFAPGYQAGIPLLVVLPAGVTVVAEVVEYTRPDEWGKPEVFYRWSPVGERLAIASEVEDAIVRYRLESDAVVAIALTLSR